MFTSLRCIILDTPIYCQVEQSDFINYYRVFSQLFVIFLWKERIREFKYIFFTIFPLFDVKSTSSRADNSNQIQFVMKQSSVKYDKNDCNLLQ